MSYESPIEVITSQVRLQSEIALGKEIMKAVWKVGVNVDKDELLKALAYDRKQYQKGYEDRDNEIVCCKDCIFRNTDSCITKHLLMDDFYCWQGTKKDGDPE